MSRQQRRRIELIQRREQYAPRSEEYRDENEVMRTRFVHQPRQSRQTWKCGYFRTRITSKYMPHQGKRECARRVKQMEVQS